MVINRLGYACINETLKEKGITCNRSMIKRTFQERGSSYASELILQNVKSLLPIFQWNEQHGIRLFRMSSDLFPWASEYTPESLPDWAEISAALASAGEYARNFGHRITMHPAQFNCLGSPNESVILNSIKDMEIHGLILDTMGMPRTPESKINVHLGGAYGEHDAAMDRFCRNTERLSDSVTSRLTVENDDKANMFSVSMLYKGVHSRIGIPIVIDSLHYTCGPADIPFREALELAASTWPTGVKPLCHHSSSRKLHEDNMTISKASHADYLYEPFEAHFAVDLMLECKAKERGLIRYRHQYCK